jgi:hypothetical protein
MGSDGKKSEPTLEEILERVLPAAVAAARQAEKPAPVAVADKVTACSACGQKLIACKGKHRQVVVCPDDQDIEPWFTGVKINNVTYRSMPGVPITVPADTCIEAILQEWVRNEKEQVRGRKRMRHSGAFSPQGSTVNPLGDKDYLR